MLIMTDTDNRRLRSDSGKDPEAEFLSEPMTEVATEQMSVPPRRQQDGDQKVHSFDPETNLRKQKQPQFTVEELRAEPHKLICRKMKRFFPGYGGAFATISKYDAEKKTYFCEYADGYTEWLSLDDVLIFLPQSWY